MIPAFKSSSAEGGVTTPESSPEKGPSLQLRSDRQKVKYPATVRLSVTRMSVKCIVHNPYQTPNGLLFRIIWGLYLVTHVQAAMCWACSSLSSLSTSASFFRSFSSPTHLSLVYTHILLFTRWHHFKPTFLHSLGRIFLPLSLTQESQFVNSLSR